MLYVINDKCYVNIAPSIYVEVVISKDGNITPTNNKLEVTPQMKIEPTTLNDWLKKFVEPEPEHFKNVVDRKYNKRKK